MINQERKRAVKTKIGEIQANGVLVLFALWNLGEPATIDELSEAIGKNRGTIKNAIKALNLYGYLAEYPAGRWPRFGLSDTARQLAFGDLMSKITASGSSSSKVLVEGTFEIPSQTTTTTTLMAKKTASDSNKLPPHPDRRRLIDLLIDVCNCESHRIAAEAIDAALEQDHPIDIELRALWWVFYLMTNRKWQPDAPGIFIARKVQLGEDEPIDRPVRTDDYRIDGMAELVERIRGAEQRKENLEQEASQC